MVYLYVDMNVFVNRPQRALKKKSKHNENKRHLKKEGFTVDIFVDNILALVTDTSRLRHLYNSSCSLHCLDYKYLPADLPTRV